MLVPRLKERSNKCTFAEFIDGQKLAVNIQPAHLVLHLWFATQNGILTIFNDYRCSSLCDECPAPPSSLHSKGTALRVVGKINMRETIFARTFTILLDNDL